MSGFFSRPNVELLDDNANDGRGRWRLRAPLVYLSGVAKRQITVPEGFETDFASVPRLPVAYWLTGGTANSAAIMHDYLYATGELPRKLADQVLLEAMEVTGVPWWRRQAMYWAVRLFGGGRYGPTYAAAG